MGANESRQLLGEMLLSARIAQQALTHAKEIARPKEARAFIDQAVAQLCVIAGAAQLVCAGFEGAQRPVSPTVQ
jgi:hypothetical protein